MVALTNLHFMPIYSYSMYICCRVIAVYTTPGLLRIHEGKEKNGSQFDFMNSRKKSAIVRE